jgi:hypothetical protein
MKHYIVTITRKQEAEIVVQAESQEEAFDIAEKCIPPKDTKWHYTSGSQEADREDWEDEQLEARKVTAYKSVTGDAIMVCPDSSVVSAEGEKKKWDTIKSCPPLFPPSVALDLLTEEMEKKKEKPVE